jgi:hypothetical protein
VIWVLPDVKRPPLPTMEKLFYAYFIVMVMWPNYLAIALPGLPWITLQRLVALPLSLILLICISASHVVRVKLSAVLGAAPWVRNLLFAFLLLQVISVGFSAQPFFSINQLVTVLTTDTAIFLAGCLLFAEDGQAERMAGLLVATAVGLSLIAALEVRMGKTPWADSIPSFLKIEDPSVLLTLKGAARSGLARRAQATYSTALGLGEFLAIVFPFALHFAVNPYRRTVRAAAIFAIPLLVFAVAASQSRLGFAGYFITGVTYPLLWASIHWRRRSTNVFVNAIVYLSPIFMAVASVALFTVDAIRYRVLGGGATEYSDQGRVDQLNMAIPKILSHPWGYGIGRGAETLDYRSPSGQLAIDSYYVRLALEYGPMGLAIFVGLFAAAVFYAGRAVFSASPDTNEKALFLPVGVALVNVLVIKSVYATEDNAPVVFAIFAMLVGLTYRTFGRTFGGSVAVNRQEGADQTTLSYAKKTANPALVG